jgi:hypothetical protein
MPRRPTSIHSRTLQGDNKDVSRIHSREKAHRFMFLSIPIAMPPKDESNKERSKE